MRCITDEVPFDIPDTWEWVRLGAISSYAETKQKVNAQTAEASMWGLDLEDIEKGGKLIAQRPVSDRKAVGDKTCFYAGDILYSKLRPYLLKILVAPADGICTPEIVPFRVYGGILADYVVAFLKSPYVDAAINSVTYGVKMPRVGTDTMTALFVPIPPIGEQLRIVDRIKELEPSIADYDTSFIKAKCLNDAFPEKLKKSILQMAVQGKLVPQDPADEPANVLLERIREEKTRLVKEGKIKRDKHESVIFRRDNSHYEKRGSEDVCIDEEIPFEIPCSWEIVRLNDIGQYRKGPFGSSLTKSMFVPKSTDSVKVYEQKNAIQKNHTLGSYYITRDYYESKMKSFSVMPGDIIVSCAGTIGETYVLPDGIEEGIINQALMRMNIFAPINIEFFLLYFDYVLKSSAKSGSKGSAIKNIPPFEVFKQLLLPLPPLEEQQRIVDAVNKLLSVCNTLSE